MERMDGHDHHHHHDQDHDHDQEEVVVVGFHHSTTTISSYPCAYYVQSPSTVSHANSATDGLLRNNTTLSSTADQDYFSSSNGHHKKISYDARSHETAASIDHHHQKYSNSVDENRRLIISNTTLDGDHHCGSEDEDDDYEYYYGEKRGWWKKYCSYRDSDSSCWICIQISWRFLVSLCVALLVFYIASRPPPPKLSIQIGRVGVFGLGEGVDSSGVTTKILTCNCSLNLIIDNKSRLFGLHIHPPTIDMSFERLTFALAHGPKMYAETGWTSFPLYIGTKNKPLYGAGRDMEDMLESSHGMPLLIRMKLSSSFKVIPRLIHPKYHHQAHCLLILRRPNEKAHRTHLYNSTCTVNTL
uniref:Late embryogenesis abundant protein LEA-2 subgroup domain-containing protein n=1 Tax=Cannabis sativa TaxID=3483 RepID=A0A803P4L0_CANSA